MWGPGLQFFAAAHNENEYLVPLTISDSKQTSATGISLGLKMSRILRKPAFCICENKDADQLRGNRKADQLLCFRYINSTIPLLPI